MKKLLKSMSALCAALLALSCAKELIPENTPVEEEATFTECTFSASIEEGDKLILDGLKSSWENGDSLIVCQYGRYQKGMTRDKTMNVFVAQSSGNKVMFTGTIKNYKVLDPSLDDGSENSSDNIFSFTYPASAVSSYNAGSSVGVINVPSTQTGQIEDFGKYAMYNYSFTEKSTNTSYDPESDKLSINVDVKLSSITPVLKFNIPASLNATKIEIYGRDENGNSIGITGKYKARLSSSASSFEPAADSVITLSNGGSVLSGDTFVVLAPTKKSSTNIYQNDAKIFIFKIFNADNARARVVGRIKGNVAMSRVIKDLGSLPSTLTFKDVSVPYLLETAESRIALRDTTAGSTFYYTMGFDNDSCPEPTLSSIPFKACEGFATSTATGNRIVKILVHNDNVEDRIITAMVRRFNFSDKEEFCTTIVRDSLEAGSKFTLGDLSVYNGTTKIIAFKVKSSYMELMNSTYFSFNVLNKSNVSVHMSIKSNNTSRRAFKTYLCEPESFSTSAVYYEGTSTTSSEGFAGRLVDFGGLDAESPITIWHNGGTYMQSYTILEEGESISYDVGGKFVIDVVSDGTLPSTTVTTETQDFYCEGYKFTIPENNDGEGNYAEFKYTTYFYWNKVGAATLPFGNAGYIKLPVIPGYILSKVTFNTSSQNKHAYVTKALSYESGNRIGTVDIPQDNAKDASILYTIDVNDPGTLSEYYFAMTYSSSLNVRNLKLYYTKPTN